MGIENNESLSVIRQIASHLDGNLFQTALIHDQKTQMDGEGYRKSLYHLVTHNSSPIMKALSTLRIAENLRRQADIIHIFSSNYTRSLSDMLRLTSRPIIVSYTNMSQPCEVKPVLSKIKKNYYVCANIQQFNENTCEKTLLIPPPIPSNFVNREICFNKQETALLAFPEQRGSSQNYMSFFKQILRFKSNVNLVLPVRSALTCKIKSIAHGLGFNNIEETLLDSDHDLLARCDAAVCLNPALYSGSHFGESIATSIGLGVPVISTSYGFGPELITPGKTGWVLSEKNMHYLPEIVSTIVKNRTRISVMKKQCKTLANLKYSAKRIANMYSSLYRNVLDLS